MSEQMRILKMIEDGEVTPEEGAQLLSDLGNKPLAETHQESVMGILEKIENGELSPQAGISRLNEQGGKKSQAVQFEVGRERHSPPNISEKELERWKQWWKIPVYIGISVVILSALGMNAAYQNAGYGFWFFCSWVPFAIGIGLVALSWSSQEGPWIHVRVSGKDHVAFSMPAPLRLAGWGLRNFGHFIPQLDQSSIDEIITALDQSISSSAPLYINVDEEDGEHVEVFIG